MVHMEMRRARKGGPAGDGQVFEMLCGGAALHLHRERIAARRIPCASAGRAQHVGRVCGQLVNCGLRGLTW